MAIVVPEIGETANDLAENLRGEELVIIGVERAETIALVRSLILKIFAIRNKEFRTKPKSQWPAPPHIIVLGNMSESDEKGLHVFHSVEIERTTSATREFILHECIDLEESLSNDDGEPGEHVSLEEHMAIARALTQKNGAPQSADAPSS